MCYSPFSIDCTSYWNVYYCKQMDDTHVMVIPRGFGMLEMVFHSYCKNQFVLCLDDQMFAA
jgi:hypothetical protein